MAAKKKAKTSIPDGVVPCDSCRDGMDSIIEKESLSMTTLGWYAHFVQGDEDYPFGLNLHTHGVKESFKHKDFQACVPVDPNIPHSIVALLIDKIKEGRVFKAGEKVSGILNGGDGTYVLTFKAVREGGRSVLRVIFPDVKGSVDPETMDHPWKHQWE